MYCLTDSDFLMVVLTFIALVFTAYQFFRIRRENVIQRASAAYHLFTSFQTELSSLLANQGNLPERSMIRFLDSRVWRDARFVVGRYLPNSTVSILDESARQLEHAAELEREYWTIRTGQTLAKVSEIQSTLIKYAHSIAEGTAADDCKKKREHFLGLAEHEGYEFNLKRHIDTLRVTISVIATSNLSQGVEHLRELSEKRWWYRLKRR